ncbi:hypothetical protein ACPPVT_14320 [Angustibacter sp. McL0619]|uniref:hypothetical protein n=1 Tax=Angustibacter sp. McL0619 TaxID=3415676 RepID=UPI003CF6A00B
MGIASSAVAAVAVVTAAVTTTYVTRKTLHSQAATAKEERASERRSAAEARLWETRADLYRKLSEWLVDARQAGNGLHPADAGFRGPYSVEFPADLLPAADVFAGNEVRIEVHTLNLMAAREEEQLRIYKDIEMALPQPSKTEAEVYAQFGTHPFNWENGADAIHEILQTRGRWLEARAALAQALRDEYEPHGQGPALPNQAPDQ